eukprot:scaffold2441_cov413-Prasinococcus_capsulatus_cf.AAC.7
MTTRGERRPTMAMPGARVGRQRGRRVGGRSARYKVRVAGSAAVAQQGGSSWAPRGRGCGPQRRSPAQAAAGRGRTAMEPRGAAEESQMPARPNGKVALAAGFSQIAWMRRMNQEPERTPVPAESRLGPRTARERWHLANRWVAWRTDSYHSRCSPATLRTVAFKELRQHNTLEDAWTVLRGKVYNITPYMQYHPGGRAFEEVKGLSGSSLSHRPSPLWGPSARFRC